MQGRKKHLDAIMKTELLGDKCRAEIEQVQKSSWTNRTYLTSVFFSCGTNISRINMSFQLCYLTNLMQVYMKKLSSTLHSSSHCLEVMVTSLWFASFQETRPISPLWLIFKWVDNSFFCKWNTSIIFSSQTHGENAPECLTLVYYTELADKDLVLMKGDYDKDILVSSPLLNSIWSCWFIFYLF